MGSSVHECLTEGWIPPSILHFQDSIDEWLPASRRLSLVLDSSPTPRRSNCCSSDDTFVKRNSFIYPVKDRKHQNHRRLSLKRNFPANDNYTGLRRIENSPSNPDPAFRRLLIRYNSSSAKDDRIHSSISKSSLPPIKSSQSSQDIPEVGIFNVNGQILRMLKPEIDVLWTILTATANVFKNSAESWERNIARQFTASQHLEDNNSECCLDENMSGFLEPLSKSYAGQETDLSVSSDRATISSGDDSSPLNELEQGGLTTAGPNEVHVEAKSHVDQLHQYFMKQKIVQRWMEDFWKYFNQDLKLMAAEAGTSSTKNTSDTTSTTFWQSTTTNHKRHERETSAGGDDIRGDDDGDDDGDDEPRRSKRSRAGSEQQHSVFFACPYRKRDPRKYSVRDWRSCALTPHTTIARVKGHLYRHHLVHQCERCNELFKTQDELNSHRRAMRSCELSEAVSAPEGITSKMLDKLRSRRKAFAGQTETERWGQIYQILFPDTETSELPSPYFEPIQDTEGKSPLDSTDLSRYEAYLRFELPRLVRVQLEKAVNSEMQSIEAGLRAQILSIVNDAQAQAFENFRALETPEVADEIISSTSGYPGRLLEYMAAASPNSGLLPPEDAREHQFFDQIFNDTTHSDLGSSSTQTSLTLPPPWAPGYGTEDDANRRHPRNYPTRPYRSLFDVTGVIINPATRMPLGSPLEPAEKDLAYTTFDSRNNTYF